MTVDSLVFDKYLSVYRNFTVYVNFCFNMMLIPIDSSVVFAKVTFTFYLKSKNKGQYFLLCNGVTYWGGGYFYFVTE